MKPRFLAPVSLLAAITMSVIACGDDDGGRNTDEPSSSEDGATATQDLEKVRIGVVAPNIVLYLGVHAAEELGLYEEEGLDAELVVLPGGADSLSALLGGSVDMIVQAAEGSALVHAQGENVVNVMAAQDSLNWSLVMRSGLEGEVEPGNFDDLRGRRLGVSALNGSSGIQLQSLLRAGGLEPGEDVELVEHGSFPAGLSAMDNEELDGLILLEHSATLARDEGHFEFIFWGDEEVYPNSDEIPLGALSTTQDFIDDHSDIVEGVIRANVEADIRLVEDPEFAIDYAAELTEVDRSTLEAFMEERFLPFVGPRISEDGWNGLTDTMEDAGVLESPAPYDEVVATQFSDLWNEFYERTEG